KRICSALSSRPHPSEWKCDFGAAFAKRRNSAAPKNCARRSPAISGAPISFFHDCAVSAPSASRSDPPEIPCTGGAAAGLQQIPTTASRFEVRVEIRRDNVHYLLKQRPQGDRQDHRREEEKPGTSRSWRFNLEVHSELDT